MHFNRIAQSSVFLQIRSLIKRETLAYWCWKYMGTSAVMFFCNCMLLHLYWCFIHLEGNPSNHCRENCSNITKTLQHVHQYIAKCIKVKHCTKYRYTHLLYFILLFLISRNMQSLMHKIQYTFCRCVKDENPNSDKELEKKQNWMKNFYLISNLHQKIKYKANAQKYCAEGEEGSKTIPNPWKFEG